MVFLFQGCILRFHVHLRGCMPPCDPYRINPNQLPSHQNTDPLSRDQRPATPATAPTTWRRNPPHSGIFHTPHAIFSTIEHLGSFIRQLPVQKSPFLHHVFSCLRGCWLPCQLGNPRKKHTFRFQFVWLISNLFASPKEMYKFQQKHSNSFRASLLILNNFHQGTSPHPTLGKREIIDSKVPAGMGYVSSKKGVYTMRTHVSFIF